MLPTLREIASGLVVASIGGLVVGYFSGLWAGLAIGVALLLFDAGWRRWQKPKRIARQLDEACRYIIKNRAIAEEKARSESAFHLGPFELPVSGKGFIGESMYGPLSVAEARQAFLRLEELGVLKRTFSDANRTEYRWTELGEKVKAQVQIDQAAS